MNVNEGDFILTWNSGISKVVLFPPYGAVFTSDSYLRVFKLNDGEEISSTRMFSTRNIENKSIEYFPDFIAANEEFVIITLEDNKFSIYEKIETQK